MCREEDGRNWDDLMLLLEMCCRPTNFLDCAYMGREKSFS